MDPLSAVAAFSAAAALLTVTPGPDTALVLRTAAVEGGRPAMLAGGGIVTGVLAWGLTAALGLGALLAWSQTAYGILQIVGAGYLIWLGGPMLLGALRRRGGAAAAGEEPGGGRPGRWFWRGLMTNLLNPKVGFFYVSLLPPFIPPDAPVALFGVGLAAIHAAMGLAWFALLVSATRPLARVLRRPPVARALDGITGAVLVAVGLRLILVQRAG